MKKTWSVPVLVLFSAVAHAQCRVLDPELQGSYSGPCVNGLAEGHGIARGSAVYEGDFKAGMKDGKGVKTWPNGDRYEGGFVADRRQGHGVYTWGRGPWQGERYDGEYANDRRDGYGEYHYASGDIYRGEWKDDAAIGEPTEMMKARATYEREALAAVSKPGTKVCRERDAADGKREWQRGSVEAVEGDRVGVRVNGELQWGPADAWTPCY